MHTHTESTQQSTLAYLLSVERACMRSSQPSYHIIQPQPHTRCIKQQTTSYQLQTTSQQYIITNRTNYYTPQTQTYIFYIHILYTCMLIFHHSHSDILPLTSHISTCTYAPMDLYYSI